MTRLGLIHGDGIGPEIVPAAVHAVDAAVERAGCPPITWEELPTGWRGLEEAGHTLPEGTRETLAELPGWLMGPHDSSAYPEPWKSRLSPHGFLRQHFELFANIRPVRCLPGVDGVVSDMDLAFDVLLTENMHGDILSDLAGELAGALGMSPSLNAGDGRAMAQAAYGSAPTPPAKGSPTRSV